MHILFKLRYLLIAVILTSGCMKTTYVSIMRPAPLTIPSSIKSIALVDRTLPSNNYVNILEGIVTGETIGQDRQAVQQVFEGLLYTMTQSGRYTVIKTSIELKCPGNGIVIPEPLSWAEVERICNSQQADALLTIEAFDSDFIVTNGSKVVETKNKEGQPIKTTEFYAEGIAGVKVGFRLYDPVQKVITDQYNFNHSGTWNAKGSNVRDAVAHLIDSRQAVKKVGYDAGNIYGSRISPTWFQAGRQYYKKSKKDRNVAYGARKASVNDWTAATEIWQGVVNQSDYKSSGRACFNLALAWEVRGDLQTARECAQKAYSEFNIKKGKDYSNVLLQRIYQQERLNQQMKE